jgi:hypothetical protein
MSKVDELVRAFETLTLPKDRWTHAAHLTVAMHYLRRMPRAEATDQMRRNIRAYNASVGGDPNAYHETITRAWMLIVAQFLAQQDETRADDALALELTETWAKSDALLRFYTRERLFSPAAREGWVLPDLEPLG